MTNKIRLIPFDYQKYKAGMKAFLINYYHLKIINIYNNCCIPNTEFLVIFETEGKKTNNLYCNNCDLQLEETIEEKTFYVNVYHDDCSARTVYKTLSQAKEGAYASALGTLKVTYTDEDLIR